MSVPGVVLHIPHSSVVIPDDVRAGIVLSDNELAAELLAMTDHFTDDLFVHPSAVRIIYPVSRLVVDPERFDDDALELMAARGMGVVYTRTSTGGVLRHAPSAEERTRLLNRFYVPHHAAFTHAVSESLHDNGRCLIVDCHSFPSVPRPYELDQQQDRPDICIGTDSCHTPTGLAEHVCDAFRAAGYSVEENSPFRGSIVPIKYYEKDAAVSSIMIEVNRGLYMDETTGERLGRFGEVARVVTGVLERIAFAIGS